MIKEDR